MQRKFEISNEANLKTQERIEDLALEAGKEGVDLERAKLALAKERALAEAKAIGASVRLVEDEFDLREKILEKSIEAEEARNNISRLSTTVSGSFGGAAVERGFQAGGGQNRLISLNESIDKNTKKTANSLDRLQISFN
jgi:hypothetical protein